MLLLLVTLTLFFGSGQYIVAPTALRQEVDGLQVEQLIDYQVKVEKTPSIDHSNSISSFLSLTYFASLQNVLHLVESASVTEARLPRFGQRIVSFLAKSRICHKTSDNPHLFSC